VGGSRQGSCLDSGYLSGLVYVAGQDKSIGK
jgi:hypothetical protein